MVSLSEAGYEVSSFDFYYDEVHQKFRICFSQRKNQLSELLVSEEIVLNQTHLEQFKSYLKYESKRLSQPSRIVDHITMDQRGVLFSTSFEKTDALYHYFEYHRQPENYTLPENTIQAKQLSVGRLYGDYGVFVLYEIGKNGTMLFQSFPEKEGAEISQYRFETGEVISCFDLLEDEAGNSILYVAGKGIFKFDSPDDEKEQVAPKTISYSKIDVSKNDDDVTIWALDKKDRYLYYITNTFQQIDARGNYLNTIQRWTLPLKMHEGITEFTAIKGDNFTNQLFYLILVPNNQN